MKGVLAFSAFFSAVKDIFLEKNLQERQKTQKKRNGIVPWRGKAQAVYFIFLKAL